MDCLQLRGLYPCGKCIPCLNHRKRCREMRLLMELKHSVTGAFVTLTASPENEFQTEEEVRQESQKLIKRVRDTLGRQPRYQAQVERGTRGTRRLHLHIAFFNVHPGLLQMVLSKVWKAGFFDVKELDPKHVGYLIKDLVKDLDADEEQMRMMASKHPPIGHKGVEAVAELYRTGGGKDYLRKHGDVVPGVRMNGNIYPMDAWFIKKLREKLGIAVKQKARIFDMAKNGCEWPKWNRLPADYEQSMKWAKKKERKRKKVRSL